MHLGFKDLADVFTIYRAEHRCDGLLKVHEGVGELRDQGGLQLITRDDVLELLLLLFQLGGRELVIVIFPIFPIIVLAILLECYGKRRGDVEEPSIVCHITVEEIDEFFVVACLAV